MQPDFLGNIVNVFESAKAERMDLKTPCMDTSQCTSKFALQMTMEVKESVPKVEDNDRSGLLFDMIKNENRDLKSKLEKLLNQIRNRDSQITMLQATVETMKTQQTPLQPSFNPELEKYCNEYDSYIEFGRKLDELDQPKAIFADLEKAYRKSCGDVKYLESENEQLKATNKFLLDKKQYFLEELAQRKATLLNLTATVECLENGKRRQLQTAQSALDEKGKIQDALEKERALNSQLVAALSAAEKDGAAIKLAICENACNYDRALNRYATGVPRIAYRVYFTNILRYSDKNRRSRSCGSR